MSDVWYHKFVAACGPSYRTGPHHIIYQKEKTMKQHTAPVAEASPAESSLLISLKWAAIALLCGLLSGLVGSLLVKGMGLVVSLQKTHPVFLFLLPVAGILILCFYRLLKADQTGGTDQVLRSASTGEKVPLSLVPAIFFSTLLSHLAGASVGREGAALQVGGTIGSGLTRLFYMKAEDRPLLVQAGMAAAFSAVFGTPITAVLFALETTQVGRMTYHALLPCIISSLSARLVADRLFGIPAAFYQVTALPAADLVSLLKAGLLAACCGLISALFCLIIHRTKQAGKRFFPNPLLRSLVFGSLVLVLSCLTGGSAYNGSGSDLIAAAISPEGPFSFLPRFRPALPGPLAPSGPGPISVTGVSWLLKMVFTALSLTAAYKGGEIVPTFCIGATFGCLFGHLLSFPPAFGAAIGLGAVFCGATNAPVTSLFLCVELFGAQGLPYYALAIALAYLTSGGGGLYSTQKLVFPKYRSPKPEQ